MTGSVWSVHHLIIIVLSPPPHLSALARIAKKKKNPFSLTQSPVTPVGVCVQAQMLPFIMVEPDELSAPKVPSCKPEL